MTQEQQIKALAELDGWTSLGQDAEMIEHWIQFPRDVVSRLSYDEIRKQRRWSLPPYLTSYDAIIPLIQKQDGHTLQRIWWHINQLNHVYKFMVSPAQLCEALLRATGRWTE